MSSPTLIILCLCSKWAVVKVVSLGYSESLLAVGNCRHMKSPRTDQAQSVRIFTASTSAWFLYFMVPLSALNLSILSCPKSNTFCCGQFCSVTTHHGKSSCSPWTLWICCLLPLFEFSELFYERRQKLVIFSNFFHAIWTTDFIISVGTEWLEAANSVCSDMSAKMQWIGSRLSSLCLWINWF